MAKLPDDGASWASLSPPFRQKDRAMPLFAAYARRLGRFKATSDTNPSAVPHLNELRESLVAALDQVNHKDRPSLHAAALVLTDLVMQGWPVRVRNQRVQIKPPTIVAGDPDAEKSRVRRQELVKRDAQLQQPATRDFIAGMERVRLFGDVFVSVFSLMRDGRELADALRQARRHHLNGWADALKRAVDPYLQFVVGDGRCRHTGLRLIDVWRYFRHTWTNQYASVPGRSIMFLVRDRAAPFHPVIGIGALNSPIMQIRERDRWIGWHPETFLGTVIQNPTDRMAKWLVKQLASAIAEIYVDDLIEDGIITARSIREPTSEYIEKLATESARQRRRHHRYARSREHKARRTHADHWVGRARTHLFRSKRALALAELLQVRATLAKAFGKRPTATKLALLLETSAGRKAVSKIVRKVKADRIGIAVADISVCGAVPPYNAILGGKLVSMLATGAETVAEYQRRYANAESEIASAMAGRAIMRPATLVLLGTTSLYGVGSSQYNRIKIPCGPLGGRDSECVTFEELGHSLGVGTSQYSEETVAALVNLVQQSKEGQRVNSIFGEGISPKLRKVRQGLDLLGFPSDMLTRHYRQRVVYGVSLIRNLRAYLLAMAPRPHYLLPRRSPVEVTSGIAAWWRERWLRGRIQNDAILEEVAKHTHVRPMRHGARVALPGLSSTSSIGLKSTAKSARPVRQEARRGAIAT